MDKLIEIGKVSTETRGRKTGFAPDPDNNNALSLSMATFD
jgi:hypothetical protein